jgi:molecular chaperone GrpE
MSDETDKTFATENDSAPTAAPDTTSGTAPEELVPSEWTSEQVEEWKEKAAKAQDYWDRLVRVSADFDNYKKRAARERQDSIRYANEGLLEKLALILDNLDMALAAANNPQANTAEAMKTGITMIFSQLRNVLSEAGLEEIDAIGKPFDPNWHEAVSQQESVDVPDGHVIQQIRKGYKLKDRLLRPASVVVAKKHAA